MERPHNGRLLLEEELRRSCILTDDSQVDEISDLVMDLLSRGLIGGNLAKKAAPSPNFSSSRVADGRPVYCQPRYDGDGTQPKFLVRFADAEVSDRFFDDEAEGRAFFEAAIENWNCYLFGLLER